MKTLRDERPYPLDCRESTEVQKMAPEDVEQTSGAPGTAGGAGGELRRLKFRLRTDDARIEAAAGSPEWAAIVDEVRCESTASTAGETGSSRGKKRKNGEETGRTFFSPAGRQLRGAVFSSLKVPG